MLTVAVLDAISLTRASRHLVSSAAPLPERHRR
jgi:hypothetical protein